MIDLTCKHCHRTVQQHGGEICDACSAKGVGLRQIKKVEKWEARDGTFHDSLEAAQTHQLMSEVTTALRTCEGRPDSQARHLLSHFDIVRKGDTPKGMFTAPATVAYHKAPNVVCTTCYLVSGAVIGCLLTLSIIWFR